MNTLSIVIPMKAPTRSKQRLMSVLTMAQRETLAITLYRATLRFFTENYPTIHCLVVTESAEMGKIATSYGANVLLEEKPAGLNGGLNGAVEAATQWNLEHGFHHQLVIPADIPQLDTREIEQLFAAANQSNAVVVGLAKDSGTNALLTSPPNAIGFRFGTQSGFAHAQEAYQQGLSVEVLRLPLLSQDIDVPADLQRIYPAYQPKEPCYESPRHYRYPVTATTTTTDTTTITTTATVGNR